MANTPEGRIKKKIKLTLDKYYEICYVYMPVPSGYGKTSLDYLGAVAGRAFAVEAKAPGKQPSPRQWLTIREMARGNVKVFVIDGDEGVAELDEWLGAQ